MAAYTFNIEILGSGQCNLRCPSCAVANSSAVRNPMGMMRPALLERIMRKATAECTVTSVALYNWAEPLLHPQLPELVEIVQSFGTGAHLSSNLNYAPDLEGLMRANPAEFRVSASGFSQEQYGVTHKGGDIEVVKRNMRALAAAKRATGATTRIHVAFHRYKDNLGDELAMARFCAELGFDFFPIWAYMTPLEKVLAIVDDDQEIATVTSADRDVMERLVPSVGEGVALAHRFRSQPCELLEEQMTLDFRGAVMQCCAVYDAEKFRVGTFLDEPIASLQAKKRAGKICARCMDHGIHAYFTKGAGEELDELAIRRRSAYRALDRAGAVRGASS